MTDIEMQFDFKLNLPLLLLKFLTKGGDPVGVGLTEAQKMKEWRWKRIWGYGKVCQKPH